MPRLTLAERVTAMLRIRRFEEQCIRLSKEGPFSGHYHVYIGQEPTAVAACTALAPEDFVFSTWRNHGHLLARGAAPDRMMAEILGKAVGKARIRREGRDISIIALLAAAIAHAQDPASSFPSKPIRIFGQGTGSTADYLSRYLSQRLLERWGQPVIVDSRAGAGGTIPTDVVAKSPPDGYNLVMGHAGPFVSAMSLYAKTLPYDPLKDFEPVTMVATGVTVLVAAPSVPVSSAQQLIAYAKQKGDLTYGSAGNGSISHLTGELLKNVTGVPLQHIPYKSAGNALTAVLASEVHVSFLSPLTAHGPLKSGRLRGLAVSSTTRFPGAPDIPSAAEAGIPGMQAKLWFGLFAPAKTPRSIVTKLNVEAFRVRSKSADLEQAGKVALRMSLKGIAKNITCPIYIVAGTKDRLTPSSEARKLAAEVSGPCVLSVIEGGNHVVNNLWYRYRDQTADWMARQLGAA